MPHASTLIRTWPRPGSGTGRSTTSKFPPGLLIWTAFIGDLFRLRRDRKVNSLKTSKGLQMNLEHYRSKIVLRRCKKKAGAVKRYFLVADILAMELDRLMTPS